MITVARDGDSGARVRIDTGGTMAWGAGANFGIDSAIYRSGDGSLVMQFPTNAAWTVPKLQVQGGGMRQDTNGEGLLARSPDGTLYRLAPPNGGGAATWVPA